MTTKLQILGTGCMKCKMLGEHVERAAKELGIDYELEKVTNIEDILDFGVVATPALVVAGEVKVSGHVPTVARIKDLLAGVGAAES
jgi:small redox-active disulfide protein 2